MSYIFIKKVFFRYTYYLNKNNEWVGLREHGKKHYDYSTLTEQLLILRSMNPKEKVDFIDLNK